MLDFTPPQAACQGSTDTATPERQPDDLEWFVSAFFRYASVGVVSLRAFPEGGNSVFRIEAVPIEAGLDAVVARARALIGAAKLAGRIVVCPPIATFNPPDDQPNKAREQDLAEGLALSVECDSNPGAARARLAALLGPPTAVVESGGVTHEGEAKLHLHWRLNEPTDCREDHLRLKQARALATAIVGGDASNISVVHPIRWPMSWHCKGESRLARIAELNEDAEIDLSEALETLQDVAPSQAPHTPRETPTAAPAGAHVPATHREDAELIAAIQEGASLHEPIAALAARYIGRAMPRGTATTVLRSLMEAVPVEQRDERWQNRFDDIPRAVQSAEEKYGGSTRHEANTGALAIEYFEDIQPNLTNAWLVRKTVPLEGLVLVYGSPGAGKSFLTLDMALRIAAGMSLDGRSVKQCPVIYLAAEGQSGLRGRVAAFREHHGVASLPFALIGTALNLVDDKADLARLREAIRGASARFEGKPGFIVLDTLAATFGGGDENGPAMVGYVNNAKTIAQEFSATVAIVHHRPKDLQNNTPRGHGSLAGAADTIISVEGGSVRSAKVTKQKDAEPPTPINFKLHKVTLGVDEEGAPVRKRCGRIPGA